MVFITSGILCVYGSLAGKVATNLRKSPQQEDEVPVKAKGNAGGVSVNDKHTKWKGSRASYTSVVNSESKE